MKFPDPIGKAPVLFLTGAGASVPLGRFTSAQFVNSFFNSARVRDIANRDKTTYGFTTFLQFKPQADIETILSYLEANVSAGERFSSDPEFVKRVLYDNSPALGAFIAMNLELRDALYAEIMDHFSDVDTERAGQLYEPLLADFIDWFREVPGSDQRFLSSRLTTTRR